MKVVSIFSLIGLAFLFPAWVTSLKEKATGHNFADKTNGLELFGVGVRTKGPIKVYAVGTYGHKNVKKSLRGLSADKDKKKALDLLQSKSQQGPTTFLLKFSFKVGAEKVSSSITDAISSRFKNKKDTEKLRSLLCDGVEAKGGKTKKGTTMQFDCSKKGVKVHLDGKNLGFVGSGGVAKALCGVYLDKKSVSPSLRQSCIDHSCEP